MILAKKLSKNHTDERRRIILSLVYSYTYSDAKPTLICVSYWP